MKRIPYGLLAERLPLFLQQFFEPAAAEACARVMLYAERHGIAGQGLLKMLGTEPVQDIVPQGKIEITERHALAATLNANKQPSFYVAEQATDLAIQKACRGGVGLAGAHGFYSSTGALAYYAERAAEQGLVALVMARSPGAIAPFGTTKPLFGTNPLAFAFPTTAEPIVFDMATAAITWYELVLAKMRGEAIPDGVAIDAAGELTNDPTAAMQGGILPFDKAHKGAGLAMMVEMMAGPLVGASFCDFKTFDQDWGFFILAFQPDLLGHAAQFKQQATELVEIVASQDKADGSGKVRLPGARGRQHAVRVLQSDELWIEDEAAALLGL